MAFFSSGRLIGSGRCRCMLDCWGQRDDVSRPVRAPATRFEAELHEARRGGLAMQQAHRRQARQGGRAASCAFPRCTRWRVSLSPVSVSGGGREGVEVCAKGAEEDGSAMQGRNDHQLGRRAMCAARTLWWLVLWPREPVCACQAGVHA